MFSCSGTDLDIGIKYITATGFHQSRKSAEIGRKSENCIFVNQAKK